MADCHSADVGKRCPQPWCLLQALSIVPLRQCLQGVLDGGTEPRRPDAHPTVPPAIPWCLVLMQGAADFHVTRPSHTPRASGLAGWGQFGVFSHCSATVSASAPHVLGRLQDWAPRYPAGPWSPRALTCIPPWTAAAALWTFTFPLLKLKTRHITKLRAPKISGGKHYWEQKPGRLFFRGWLLFQSVLASIFFPQHWNPWVLGSLRKEGALMPEDKEPR